MARQKSAGRSALLRRLRWLRNWELFDAALFFALLVWWILTAAPSTWALTAYSVSLVCYMLLQGALYWHSKGQSVAHGASRMPGYFCRVFPVLKHSSVVLLIGFPIMALIAWTLNLTTRSELIWSTAFTVFAALEYVNYYRYQLMHDTANDLRYLKRFRRLREAPLASDLRECTSGH